MSLHTPDSYHTSYSAATFSFISPVYLSLLTSNYYSTSSTSRPIASISFPCLKISGELLTFHTCIFHTDRLVVSLLISLYCCHTFYPSYLPSHYAVYHFLPIFLFICLFIYLLSDLPVVSYLSFLFLYHHTSYLYLRFFYFLGYHF